MEINNIEHLNSEEIDFIICNIKRERLIDIIYKKVLDDLSK